MSGDDSSLADFCGRARLFPLPNLVFFPQVVQPLHIFEPRYRAMTADALAGDRLIALVLLRPDWEKDYDGRPAIYPVACLGKIVAEQRLEDGRYNLLLGGLARVRIGRELNDGRSFRTAEVQLLHEVGVGGAQRHELRQRLVEAVLKRFAADKGMRREMKKLLRGKVALGGLADILTFALPLGPEVKQRQLEELDVAARVEALISHLGEPPPAVPAPDRKFPPDFSVN
jgi:Lon protease-like protein